MRSLCWAISDPSGGPCGGSEFNESDGLMKQLGLFPALLLLLLVVPVVPGTAHVPPPLAVCVGVVVLLLLLLDPTPPAPGPVPLMPLHMLLLLFTIELGVTIVGEQATGGDLIVLLMLLLVADDISMLGGFMAYFARLSTSK